MMALKHCAQSCNERASDDSLKVKLETGQQRPFAGQFRVERERIQPVVPVAEVEQTDFELGSPMMKAITDVGIVLPEIIAGNVRRVTAVRLLGPHRVGLAEETGGKVA